MAKWSAGIASRTSSRERSVSFDLVTQSCQHREYLGFIDSELSTIVIAHGRGRGDHPLQYEGRPRLAQSGKRFARDRAAVWMFLSYCGTGAHDHLLRSSVCTP